jgi:hypothetical protein
VLDNPIQAIPTHPTTPIEDKRLANNKREYIIRYEHLVMDGARIKPKAGDVIIDGENEWEVKNETGQTCFRYCDAGEVMIRIYCQKVSGTQL